MDPPRTNIEELMEEPHETHEYQEPHETHVSEEESILDKILDYKYLILLIGAIALFIYYILYVDPSIIPRPIITQLQSSTTLSEPNIEIPAYPIISSLEKELQHLEI